MPLTPCGSRATCPASARCRHRQRVELRDLRMRHVAVVAPEQLVAAIARQHDRDMRRAISETYHVGIADGSANGSSKCAISRSRMASASGRTTNS